MVNKSKRTYALLVLVCAVGLFFCVTVFLASGAALPGSHDTGLRLWGHKALRWPSAHALANSLAWDSPRH